MPEGKLNFTEKQKNQLFRDIHSQKIHLFNLPENLYNATGDEFTDAVYKGQNVPATIDIQKPENNSIRLLKKSVFQFSAAKQFQFISDMQNFLFDEKGLIRAFSEFKGFADIINDAYNKNWLEAEYITSINMSRGAADWERIQDEKDVFPFLRYETVGDANVRDEHANLNGIVKRIDDDFWSNFMPPNGWRCRCQAVQIESGTQTDLRKKKIPKLEPVFTGNSGKRATIFKQSHPYYRVPTQFKEHKKKNFGLDFPKDTNKPK